MNGWLSCGPMANTFVEFMADYGIGALDVPVERYTQNVPEDRREELKQMITEWKEAHETIRRIKAKVRADDGL